MYAIAFILALLMSVDYQRSIRMDNDLAFFIASVGVLVLYLVLSAMTEMGTKIPWKK